MSKNAITIVSLSLSLTLTPTSEAIPSIETKVECGSIVQQTFENNKENHKFSIDMYAGEVFEIAAIPVGDMLRFKARIYEPTGNEILSISRLNYIAPLKGKTGVLSHTGSYTIVLNNWNAGTYTLNVGCTLSNGEQVEPGGSRSERPSPPHASEPSTDLPYGGEGKLDGENLSSTSETVTKVAEYAEIAKEAAGVFGALRGIFGRRTKEAREEPPPPIYVNPPPIEYTYSAAPPMPPAAVQPAVAPMTPQASSPTVVQLQPHQAADSVARHPGFPGFRTTDLAALELPVAQIGVPLQGTIVPGQFQVAGFQFSSTQGTEIELTFTRLSGNMSLGLLLLDSDRQLDFQASLVANQEVRTSLALVAGEHKLGIAAIEPQPSSPVQTSFSIALNEKASVLPAPPSQPTVSPVVSRLELPTNHALDVPAPQVTTPLSVSILAVASPHKERYRVARGLSVGITAFVDRDYVYETLPPLLNGAIYVMTANDDKTDKRFSLDMSINNAATVIVAHDDRISPKPGWLRAYVDTGLDVMIGAEKHSLFKQSMPANSVIRCGANSEDPERKSNMYTVFITDRS
jgi:hypothetical protein